MNYEGKYIYIGSLNFAYLSGVYTEWTSIPDLLYKYNIYTLYLIKYM